MKVSARRAITDAITDVAKTDENIFLVCTDSRGSVTAERFFDSFPERGIECGIAEQNAISLGAGLATTGKTVFVAGPACFMSTRAYEQIKVDVAYNFTEVKVLGVSGGVSYGPLGATHLAINDMAAMRSLFNMEIFLPADDIEARFVANYAASSKKPTYIRVGRGDVERVYSENEAFEIGKAKVVRNGTDITLVAAGETVAIVKKAAEELEKSGVSAAVLDYFTIKPFDEITLRKYAHNCGCVLSVEEHSIIGGLGEACAHALAESGVPLKILGFPDEELIVGKPDELFEHYGLTASGVAKAATELIGRVKK